MALSGTIDEWAQDELGRWCRKDHPEDGVITLREGLTFADYFARRAEPEPVSVDKIADIETRLAKLEAAASLSVKR